MTWWTLMRMRMKRGKNCENFVKFLWKFELWWKLWEDRSQEEEEEEGNKNEEIEEQIRSEDLEKIEELQVELSEKYISGVFLTFFFGPIMCLGTKRSSFLVQRSKNIEKSWNIWVVYWQKNSKRLGSNQCQSKNPHQRKRQLKTCTIKFKICWPLYIV